MLKLEQNCYLIKLTMKVLEKCVQKQDGELSMIMQSVVIKFHWTYQINGKAAKVNSMNKQGERAAAPTWERLEVHCTSLVSITKLYSSSADKATFWLKAPSSVWFYTDESLYFWSLSQVSFPILCVVIQFTFWGFPIIVLKKIGKKREKSFRKNEQISKKRHTQTHGSLTEIFRRLQMSFFTRKE
jgi:hypothetical protein